VSIANLDFLVLGDIEDDPQTQKMLGEKNHFRNSYKKIIE